MKRHSEEEIRKRLKHLPAIEDHQTKEELYRKVSSHINKPERNRTAWLLPGLATAAVILLLAVFIPVFLNNMTPSTMQEESTEQQSRSDEKSSSSADNGEPETFNAPENSENFPAENKEQSVNENNSENQMTKDSPKMETQKNDKGMEDPQQLDSMVATSAGSTDSPAVFPGRNGEVVIPLVQRSTERDLVPKEFGLTERAINGVVYNIDEQSHTATVTFPENFNVSGSTWAQVIVESIRWEMDHYDVRTIYTQTESGAPVELGNYGELEELPVIQEGEYYFQVYQFDEAEERLLAPVPATENSSFKQLLEQMKGKGKSLYLEPAVPDHVRFLSTDESKEQVTIKLEHNSWASEQQLLTMIEAVLATAKQAGFKKVKFEGIHVQRFSSYDLNQPIPVPERINPVQ